MTKKEYLMSASTYSINIARYREMAQSLREAATDSSVHLKEINVQKTRELHPMATLVERALYYEQKADELAEKREVVLSNITRSIAAIEDPEAEEVLMLRYVAPCLSMADICNRLNISRSHAYSLHDKGLDQMELNLETPEDTQRHP